MISSHTIRQQFIDFFATRAHSVLPSAPIVIKDDPTLLFTNAGMNPFKDIFLGNAPCAHPRVVNTQKCLRVSGKHNDLEEVGVDTYHHTMFEMLGNWSFGDYFKEDAIIWAWDLLTKGYGIASDRLWITVFGGSEQEGLPADTEAWHIWKHIVPEERILSFGIKDNFWEMGGTGPCGPCSEIHIDCRLAEERQQSSAASLINKGDPQVIELWNLVFMEKHRTKDGTLRPLDRKFIDTGMGLERLVRVLQQKKSNYDTDIFTPIIAEAERLTGKQYHSGMLASDIAFRVIADHLRAVMFCIADGQVPENTGAGYVVKRLLRRATRYYYAHLHRTEPLLYALTPIVVQQVGSVFPELMQQSEHIRKIIYEEENAFLHTIGKGMKRLDAFFAMHPNAHTIDGNTAFELYDTYGFPLDVTQIIAKEKQLQVDEQGFEKAMQQQQARSRKGAAVDAEDWVRLKEGMTTFWGYETLQTKTWVVQYRKVVRAGQTMYQYILENTPFYAERGGQRGDRGRLIFGEDIIPIVDTQYEYGQIVHWSTHFPKDITIQTVAQVNEEERREISMHHTATHLLHAALQEIVDTTATQRGSYMTHTGLRFDFSARAKLSEEQITAIEDKVNDWIYENLPVQTIEMPYDQAISEGAKGLFGEKYGDKVRVVSIGNCSKELCGGTHIASTAALRSFRILTETSVAAGVRRIEAVCGAAARAYTATERQEIKYLHILLGGGALGAAVKKMKEEKTLLEKNIAFLMQSLMEAYVAQLQPLHKEKEGVKIWCQLLPNYKGDAQQLKQVAFLLKQNVPHYVIFLLANLSEDKSAAVLLIDDLTSDEKGLNATAIMRSLVTPALKGGGGGNSTLATAGARRASTKVLQEIVRSVEKQVWSKC